ncbi:hypothetical protein GZH53_11845 [Flavihumibacter sp. R14]|nr:hypothetical protein [Flavihumibacter soli]
MKHNLFKGMLSLALVVLISQPILAQSGETKSLSPAPAAPKTKVTDRDIHLDLKLPELNLTNINVQLARLDRTLSNIEVKVNPKIALVEKEITRVLEDINVNFNENTSLNENTSSNIEHPDPVFGDYQTVEKTKTISKTYSVDSKDKLAINNQYGKVQVSTWAKNEIKVDVEIKSYEASDSKAQEQLEGVSISESKQGDLISFKTNFDRNNMNWWSRTRNGKEEKRGVQVNYVIYMPAKNPLDITNRYGSTTLPDFSGPVNINSGYGSFTGGDLNNAANRVKVSYGSAVIEGFSAGTLDVSYGSLKLTNADNLSADIRYSNAKIGRLTNGGNLDLSYGGCKIDAMDKNVKNLVINSSYSGVTMGIDDAANFNFDVTVSYGGFNFDDSKVNITSKSPDENERGAKTTKNYKGTYGKGSDSRVIIKSSYGGVKFL